MQDLLNYMKIPGNRSDRIKILVIDTPGVSFLPNVKQLFPEFNYTPHYHGSYSAHIIGLMNPFCQVDIYPAIQNQTFQHSRVSGAIAYAANNGYDLISMSLFVKGEEDSMDRVLPIVHERGLIMVASAGNSGIQEELLPACSPFTFSIGAWDWRNNRMKDYSTKSTALDVSFPTGVSVLEINRRFGLPDNFRYRGTSCAGAVASLVITVFMNKFKDINGRKPTYDEVKEFLYTNAVDILEPGWDLKSGHGVFKQYPTNWKYEVKDKKIIKLTIGSKTISINSETIFMDVAPFIQNSRTFVPLRFVAEALGFRVNWNQDSQQITIRDNEKILILTIGSKSVFVNGQEFEIDVAPFIQDNRSFVPLRFIVEFLGYEVEWDNDERTVKIIIN